MLELDPEGSRFQRALRNSFDAVYDGAHTGRWDFSQLMKTEKTHLGTTIEMRLQREFDFSDASSEKNLDFVIAGVDVDCKWSRNLYEWEIPLEMYETKDEIALLVWANEETARWAAGLIRIAEQYLRTSSNRDRKRKLNDAGCDRIRWVFEDMDMIPNVLAMYPDVAERIRVISSGQEAVNVLFSSLPGVLINQVTVATAARQTDSSKRVRDARIRLAPEGFVIFAHYRPHPDLAAGLGLPRPTLGTFVSARLAPWVPGDPEPHVTIEGAPWRLARPDDVAIRAPRLPDQGRERGAGASPLP